MVTCPFCRLSVKQFKTNSHIIPKAFIAPLKKSTGAMAYVGIFDGLLKKKQDGIKGDFICSDCEDLFSLDDSYGSVILMNSSPMSSMRQGVTERRVPMLKVEFHELKGFDFKKLKKFILSIVLRDHCHRIVMQSPLLMEATIFNFMRDDYRNPPTGNARFKIVMHKLDNLFSDLKYTLSMPAISAFGDAITFICGGYAIMVYIMTPKDPAMDSFADTNGLIPSSQIMMPVADFTALGTFKNAKEIIEDMFKKWDDKYPNKKT